MQPPGPAQIGIHQAAPAHCAWALAWLALPGLLQPVAALLDGGAKPLHFLFESCK